MAKSAGARARSAGVLAVSPEASRRVATCHRCPLYQVTAGGTGYCGKPFLHKVLRKPSLEGCGCPVQEKAKAPAEHCPLNRFNQPAGRGKGGACDCKWCALGRIRG
jgi:hypothetical protein